MMAICKNLIYDLYSLLGLCLDLECESLKAIRHLNTPKDFQIRGNAPVASDLVFVPNNLNPISNGILFYYLKDQHCLMH